MYHLEYDRERRFLRLKMNCFWDLKTVAALTAEVITLHARVASFAPQDDRGRILLDLSDFAVQSPVTGSALALLIPQLGRRAGRVAVVTSSSPLQRQQLRRLLTLKKVSFFDSDQDALKWLFAPQVSESLLAAA